jgi:hypothetical protein
VQVIIPIVVGVVAVAVVAVVLTTRRRRLVSRPVAPVAPPAAVRREPPIPDEPPPMTDLESALARVTDSSGRPIRDRIEAERAHVDELRVVDDTGPLLRRALDHVAKPPAEPPEEPAPGGTPDTPA